MLRLPTRAFSEAGTGGWTPVTTGSRGFTTLSME